MLALLGSNNIFRRKLCINKSMYINNFYNKEVRDLNCCIQLGKTRNMKIERCILNNVGILSGE